MGDYILERKSEIPECYQDIEIKLLQIKNHALSAEIVAPESIGTSLRKMIHDEVPTMAIARVTIVDNNSYLFDRDLYMKLYLIPLKVDPDLFNFRTKGDLSYNADDTIILKLKASCPKNSPTPLRVTSGNLEWVPIEGQREKGIDFQLVSNDIEILELLPGTNIDVDLYCFKNIGRVHVKYSPVEFVTYHKIKSLKLKREVVGEEAVRLAEILEGVVEVKQVNGRQVASVLDTPNCVCYDFLDNYPEFKDAIEICDKPNHFFLKIESLGALTALTIFIKALEVFDRYLKYEKQTTFKHQQQFLQL